MRNLWYFIKITSILQYEYEDVCLKYYNGEGNNGKKSENCKLLNSFQADVF